MIIPLIRNILPLPAMEALPMNGFAMERKLSPNAFSVVIFFRESQKGMTCQREETAENHADGEKEIWEKRDSKGNELTGGRDSHGAQPPDWRTQDRMDKEQGEPVYFH